MSFNLPLQRTIALRESRFETLQAEFEEHQRTYEAQRQAFLAHQKAFETLRKEFETRQRHFESQKRKHHDQKKKINKKLRHHKVDPLLNQQLVRSYQTAISVARDNNQSTYAESLSRDLALLDHN